MKQSAMLPSATALPGSSRGAGTCTEFEKGESDQGHRLRIRKTETSDLADVYRIHTLAFGHAVEARLVKAILDDPSARPVLSLMAVSDTQPVGHFLFSTAHLAPSESRHSLALLAPLAVVPDAQRRGIGGKLVAAGVRELSNAGVDLVFVLGDPQYYSRHGFEPAGPFGLAAPYPIADEHADAWMVRALRSGHLGSVRGQILCANALNRPEYWRE